MSIPIVGPYRYTQDLLQLHSSCSPFPIAQEVLGEPPSVTKSIHNWEKLLHDTQLKDYILLGLREGFRIGFSWSQPLTSVRRNIPSAYTLPEVVDEYIRKELAAGNLIGPLSSPMLSNGQTIHTSRIGVVPKGHNSGKWRLITDLSYPPQGSVNDGIDPDICSMEYTSVDKVATTAMSLGRGALLAKIDIKSAYRLVPVSPLDRPLLGITWRGQYYIDARLPFGLRSAPKIFNAIADVLEWCFRHEGVALVDHYLDDFIILGPPNCENCARDLRIIREVSTALGIPLAEEKCEGPCTVLTFLGIQIDTVRMSLSLPAEKLDRIQRELERWSSRKSCRRRELESLLGLLHHAARVVKPGRSFLHRLTSLLKGRRREAQYIRLNAEARADIMWWLVFAKVWNGISLCPRLSPQVFVTSDASGSWGCGAFSGSEWFQVCWTPQLGLYEQIAFKELLPIVLSVMTWGHKWRGFSLHCSCDNEAVVHVVASRYSGNSSIMHLLRCLFFFEAHYDMHISASHISGHTNTLADNLSRNRLRSFFLQAPHMSPRPTPLPLMGLDLLLNTDAIWSSPAWINLLQATLQREPQEEHTTRHTNVFIHFAPTNSFSSN